MTENYNPVSFISDNILAVLPKKGVVKEITFSGFVKRFFHTNNRPNGIIKITYQKKNKEKELQLFIKQHNDAKLVFDQMVANYQNLGSANEHIPKPFLCDHLQNATYMQYFKGTPLKYIIARNILLGKFNKLSTQFKNIGTWLNLFHNSSQIQKTVKVENIVENVLKAVETTDYFTLSEKSFISTKIKSTTFPDKTLNLVKPHNDFAVRNIIYLHPDNFAVIDWDAMFHSKLPNEAPIWNDLTYFIINLLSFSRFSPLTRRNHIHKMINSFAEGYFSNGSKIKAEDFNNYLYLFSIYFYLGVAGDRPLPEIYKNWMGKKFIKLLHERFLTGRII